MKDIVLIRSYTKTLDRQAHALNQPASEDISEVPLGTTKVMSSRTSLVDGSRQKGSKRTVQGCGQG